MPVNMNGMEHLIRNFQRFLPQIVGAIVTLVSVIAVFVGFFGSGGIGEQQPPEPSRPAASSSSSSGSSSKPDSHDTEYLYAYRVPFGIRQLNAGGDVNFRGKDYPKSLVSTRSRGESNGFFKIGKEFSTLTYTAAWASDIPNSGGLGVIEIRLDGVLQDRVLVKPGKSRTRHVKVRGVDRVGVKFYALDSKGGSKRVAPKGLAVLTPTLK